MGKIAFQGLFNKNTLRLMASALTDSTKGGNAISAEKFADGLGLFDGLLELAEANVAARPTVKEGHPRLVHGEGPERKGSVLDAMKLRRTQVVSQIVSEGFLDNLIMDEVKEISKNETGEDVETLVSKNVAFEQRLGGGGVGGIGRLGERPVHASSGEKGEKSQRKSIYPTEDFVARLSEVLPDLTSDGKIVKRTAVAKKLGADIDTVAKYLAAISHAISEEVSLKDLYGSSQGPEGGLMSKETWSAKEAVKAAKEAAAAAKKAKKAGTETPATVTETVAVVTETPAASTEVPAAEVATETASDGELDSTPDFAQV